MSYSDIPATVRSIVGETPVTLAYDAICTDESQKAAWSILARGGTLVAADGGGMAARLGKDGEDDEDGKRFVRALGGVNAPFHRAFATEMYVSLSDMLEKGLVTVFATYLINASIY